MRRRILLTIFGTAIFTSLISLLMLASITYNYIDETTSESLMAQLNYISQAVEDEGIDYLNHVEEKRYRITWIDEDGDVIFDNRVDASKMENHANREEFIDAKENGLSQTQRASETMTTKLHYAAKELSDGSVLRLAAEDISAKGVLALLAKPAVFLLFLVIWFAVALGGWLLRRLVEPLDNIDLDHPLENDTYEELKPLLIRMDQQHREIEEQTKQINHQREEFQSIVDNMREGFIMLNEKRQIFLINRGAQKLLGLDDEALGKDLLSLTDNEKLAKLWKRVNNGKNSVTAFDSGERNYEVHGNPVFADNKMQGVVLFFLDVTEKRESEQLRREFSANVSHELKTPLHSISGCAELLLNDMVKEEDKKQFFQQIYDEAQHMVSLVGNIIRISKLDESDLEDTHESLPVEEVDLYEQAKQIVHQLQPSARMKNIAINISGENVSIKGVRTLLQELTYNLCDNAVKYTPEGGTVDVSVVKKKGEAILRVTDTGCGIPEEEQERIFERFYRVDKSHSRQTGDTGLGLSIVKHAAQWHHATIKVKSKVGKGTTMIVRFPLKYKDKEKKKHK